MLHALPPHGYKHTRRLIHEGANAYIYAKQRQETALTAPLNDSPPKFLSPHFSLFLHRRRWCLCQAGARRPHKAREDVTTNKNSIVTPRNLIRSHWFMLWMETEYLESGSSNMAIDSMTGAFNNSAVYFPVILFSPLDSTLSTQRWSNRRSTPTFEWSF